MKTIITFCCILILFIFSCKNRKYEKDKKDLLSICSKKMETGSLDKKIYIVTGLDGCNSCLEHTVKFIEQHVNDSQMSAIISGRSKVALKLHFTKKVINSKNIVLDTNLLAIRAKMVESGFPKVYLCRDGNIIESFEVPYTVADEKFRYIDEFMKRK